MSHPYSDACPCGDCTQHFNDFLATLILRNGVRRKEVNMTAKKPSKKKLKSKSKTTKKLITK